MKMQATVLDGGPTAGGFTDGACEMIVERLALGECEVTCYRLRDVDISPCLGCFGCWVKTPGVCVIDDAARGIAERIIGSDLLVYLTPITFGGYSSQLKKAVDRTIPLLLPLFKRIRGEVHHVPRYDRFPALVAFGVLPGGDPDLEDLFEALVHRNAVNMHTRSAAARILYEHGEAQRGLIDEALARVIE